MQPVEATPVADVLVELVAAASFLQPVEATPVADVPVQPSKARLGHPPPGPGCSAVLEDIEVSASERPLTLGQAAKHSHQQHQRLMMMLVMMEDRQARQQHHPFHLPHL